MKKMLLLFHCLLICFISYSQTVGIITTICGNGTSSDSGDGGPATAAKIVAAGSGIFDSRWNYYFIENSQIIRKISNLGIISTFVGTGGMGYGGDNGPATLALLNSPQQIACDNNNNVYIADAGNNRVRRVDALTGIITTIAGNGSAGYSGDGAQATNASISQPFGVCTDHLGNIYFSDAGNSVIRKINSTGIISTVGGVPLNGGYSGDGGPATAAKMSPSYLVCDAKGNVYVVNGNVRKINVSTGNISVFAGNSLFGYGGEGLIATNTSLGSIFAMAFDGYGNLHLSETSIHRIRKIAGNGLIYTVAGNGTAGFSGDGGSATAASLNRPEGVAFDSCGNMFIVDLQNYRIRKVTYPICYHANNVNIVNEKLISIYPNPANDVLNIDNLQSKITYTILNTVGQSIQQGTLKAGSNSISIQSLASGMYLLQLTDNAGMRSVSKVIKQ